QHLRLPDRGVQGVDQAAAFDAVVELRGEDAGAAAALAQRFGQHRFDLQQGRGRTAAEAFAAEGTDEARADDQGLEFLFVEHQRRDVRALAQQVADTGFTFDGYARQLQVGDITVDGARRDLQRLRELLRGKRRAAPAQGVDQQEQAVGAAHAT